MTTSSISLTLALGPIFGAFVQPIIGQLSDELHHPLGRRKPVMIAGALITMISTLLMAHAPELAVLSTKSRAANPWQPRAFAVACLVVILLAITAYSVGSRAIVVEACPPSQQPAAAAWSMRWNVLGSALLSVTGFVYTTQSPETDPVVAFRTLAYAYETAQSESLRTPKLEPSPPVAPPESYILYASLAVSSGTLLSTFLLTVLSNISTTLHPRNLPYLWLISQLLATTSLLLTIPFQTATASLILISIIGATQAVTIANQAVQEEGFQT
ncbi:general alpha-glucoside permease [Colletotrichum sp. SAR 10_76]|nr:general alpha-glucoside permease [Colletotrichum sp. SAR 10_76]